MKKQRKYNVRAITTISLMTAVACVLGPLSIPIGAVPLSFTSVAVYLQAYLLGWKKGTVSYALYLLLGVAGLPVFSGFSGGLAKLAGPTGGYLIGYLFTVAVSGWFIEHFREKTWMSVLGMVLGAGINYAMGVAWLALQADLSFGAAILAGMLPFLPGDAAKLALSLFLGKKLKKRFAPPPEKAD